MSTMRYTVTFREADFSALQRFLFTDRSVEHAAMLRCRVAATDEETRFLVRSIRHFEGSDLNHATARDVSVTSKAFMAVLKEADRQGEAIVFVHSHPHGPRAFSPQDDRTEPPFFATAFARIGQAQAHGSLVFAGPTAFAGRVWLPDGGQRPLDTVRVIGNRWWFLYGGAASTPVPEIFERQIRVFGPDLQRAFGRLHIGVVGAGGTGSAVIEQLVRLGVGTLTVIDDQTLDVTNVNRVYNAGVADAGVAKVELVRRAVAAIGLGTDLRIIQARITSEAVAKRLRECDIVFGCTDDDWGRAVLNALALRYLIPVIDTAARVTAKAGQVDQAIGRVTTLLPGNACLLCRNRINIERMYRDVLEPEERKRLQGLGYVQGMDEPAPAVVTFTTSVAATAVTEFLERLTGFMGEDEPPGEILHFFTERRVSRNRGQARPECDCQNPRVWGAGDTSLFLNMTWYEM